MDKEQLENLIKNDFGLNNEEIFNKLFLYFNLLIKKNESLNLTTITDLEEVYIKHFYDSLLVSKVVDLNSRISLLDLGTGAGFPGIVLKICFPKLEITLLEATTKKCQFLQEVIDTLQLQDIKVINDRAEEYIKNNRESFDIVTARAVANLNTLLELSIPYTKIGGYFLALKGLNYQDELNQSHSAARILKAELLDIYEYQLPMNKGSRFILQYNKINKTNPIYPRSYQRIKSKPL